MIWSNNPLESVANCFTFPRCSVASRTLLQINIQGVPFLHYCICAARKLSVKRHLLETSKDDWQCDLPFTPQPKFLSFLTDARSRPSSPQLHFTPIHTWASNVFFSSVSDSQRVESDSSQKSEIGSNCLAPEIWVFSKCTLKRSFTFCFAECKAYLPNLNWNNKTHRFFWTPESFKHNWK